MTKVKKLPKNPVIGKDYTITTNPGKTAKGKHLGKREVTFNAEKTKLGKSKWKIKSSKKVK